MPPVLLAGPLVRTARSRGIGPHNRGAPPSSAPIARPVLWSILSLVVLAYPSWGVAVLLVQRDGQHSGPRVPAMEVRNRQPPRPLVPFSGRSALPQRPRGPENTKSARWPTEGADSRKVPPLKTDSQLQTDVQQELKWEPGVDARHIAVTTKDGAVTLSGSVPSYFDKTRAVAATERVYGVKAVADELEVHLRDAHARDDSDIAESVAHILEWNATLASEHIQAKVANGHVTLTGKVAWNYEREEAGRAINHVLGVKSVVNRITVKPRVVAAQVEKQITNALARHAALDARQIHVTTSGTKAVLSGHVHSLDEDRVARTAAWSAPGITDVDDRLLVQP